MESYVLKVSSKSNPNSVAGAIAELIKENKKIEIQVIGAAAINQSIKAVAVANGYVAPLGITLVCIPAFTEVFIENEQRTGMKIIVKEEK